LPIPEELIDLLAEQAKRHPGRHLFPPIPHARRDFTDVLDRAEIKRVDDMGEVLTLRSSFRHTYAVLAVEGGLESLALQLALGHAKPTTTARYYEGAQAAPLVPVSFVDFQGKRESELHTPEKVCETEEAAEVGGL
jgi:integrase